jgi:hypothetical protein
MTNDEPIEADMRREVLPRERFNARDRCAKVKSLYCDPVTGKIFNIHRAVGS